MNNENKAHGGNDTHTTWAVAIDIWSLHIFKQYTHSVCSIACSMFICIPKNCPAASLEFLSSIDMRRKMEKVTGRWCVHCHRHYAAPIHTTCKLQRASLCTMTFFFACIGSALSWIRFRRRLQGVCRKAPRAPGWGGTERRQLTFANPAWLWDYWGIDKKKSREETVNIAMQAKLLSDSSHSSINLKSRAPFVRHILVLLYALTERAMAKYMSSPSLCSWQPWPTLARGWSWSQECWVGHHLPACSPPSPRLITDLNIIWHIWYFQKS